MALLLALAGCNADARDGSAPASQLSSGKTSAGTPAAASGERIVEGRLLAPCCYLQTLDVHESPMASELRLEVRTRLGAGESPEAIEDDFVGRYGERVRAVPKGKDPRRGLAYVSAGLLVVGAAGLAVLLRRWRRSSPTPAQKPRPGARDTFDDRIDEELLALDD